MIFLGSMADGRRLPAFLCAAVALHAAAGALLYSKVAASPRSVERVLSISLLPTSGQPTRLLATEKMTPPTAAVTGAPTVAETLASSTNGPPPPAATVRPVPPVVKGGGGSPSIGGLGDEELADYFYSASELTRLPALPGDPVIDLGGTSEAVDGNIELRLFIDTNGRVVKKQAEGSIGLPSGIVDTVTRAFVGYRYVPGQRQGVAVNSQVVLLIRVREGQLSTGALQEQGPN